MAFRHQLKFAAAAAAAIGFAGATAGPAAAQSTQAAGGDGAGRPNVLLFIAEDMGLSTGAYGDDTVPTPHLDALAERGVRYARAYTTSPTCSPARAGILTGLYPHANGQIGLAHLGYTMHDDVPTLPAQLEAAGYRIGRLGKLHVEGSSMRLPEVKDLGAADRRDIRLMADLAGEFAGAGDAPFFLEVSFPDAHRPFRDTFAGHPENPVGPANVKPFPEWGGLSSPEILDDVAGYYNGVQRVDAGVGMILDELRRAGRLDNTLVVFTADHGPAMARGKVGLYEFGTRVPLIVSGHGVDAAGRVVDDFASHVDIVPSILDVAGLPAGEELQGVSLAGHLGGGDVPPAAHVFTEFVAHGAEALFPMRAVRGERYKLILNAFAGRQHPTLNIDGNLVGKRVEQLAAEGEVPAAFATVLDVPAVELYDLQSDPHELHNLADQIDDDPELAAARDELAAALHDWQERTGDPMLRPEWAHAMGQYHRQHAEGTRIDMTPFVGKWPETTAMSRGTPAGR